MTNQIASLESRMREQGTFVPAKKSAPFKVEITRIGSDSKYAKQVLSDEGEVNEDGGPGSGNFGHSGRPGKVGGSGSGSNAATAEIGAKPTITPEVAKTEIRSLLDRHTLGGEAQGDADYEIAHHIARGDTIGQAMLEKSADEEKAWQEHCEEEKRFLEERYKQEMEDIERAIKPGGYLENYTKEQLSDMGLLPEKKEYREPLFYRKGELGGAVMAFSTNENGANMSPVTQGEAGAIGYDHAFSLAEMHEMGYVPIAGIRKFDVGMQGESEVLFVSKKPTTEQLAKLEHGPVTVLDLKPEQRKQAMAEESAIKSKSDERLNSLNQKMMHEMTSADVGDYQSIAKKHAQKVQTELESRNKALTQVGQKYGVTMGDHHVPYDIDKDPHFDGGPGSGNWGHAGVKGHRGGSAPGGSGAHHSKNFSPSDFNMGQGDFELTEDVGDLCLTDTARRNVTEAVSKVNSAADMESYLSGKGIKLDTSCQSLKDKRWSDEIPAVKQQCHLIIAAVEQYGEMGGLSALKTVHFWDTEIDGQGEYIYRAKGEGEVENEGHLYLSNHANGFQVMHEFAHAYADSTRPKDQDVVEWSATLNQQCGLSKKSHAYFGANSDAIEAERFADACGAALAYGKRGSGGADRVEFLSRVATKCSRGERNDGGPGSGNWGHAGVKGQRGGSAPAKRSYSSREDYNSAREAADKMMARQTARIESEYEAAVNSIRERYGNKMRQRIEIRRNSSLSESEKAEKLEEVERKFSKQQAELLKAGDTRQKKLSAITKKHDSLFEPDYEYPRIKGKHSGTDDMNDKIVNPGKEPGNCQRCAVAFEMRRRGYDVQASEGSRGELGYHWMIASCFPGAESKSFGYDVPDKDSALQRQMKQWGEGSRAIVEVRNIGWGHAFNLEVTGGEVRVFDSQIGATWSDKTSKQAGGRVNLGCDDAADVIITRTDNKKAGVNVGRYVIGRGGKR